MSAWRFALEVAAVWVRPWRAASKLRAADRLVDILIEALGNATLRDGQPPGTGKRRHLYVVRLPPDR